MQTVTLDRTSRALYWDDGRRMGLGLFQRIADAFGITEEKYRDPDGLAIALRKTRLVGEDAEVIVFD